MLLVTKKQSLNIQEDILVMNAEIMDLLLRKIGIAVNVLMIFVKAASNLMFN
jgi:hypothetical protein